MKKAYTGIDMALERSKNQFFEYNGEKYCAGTKFKMKNFKGIDKNEIVTAVFRGYSNDDGSKLNIAYNTRRDELSNTMYSSGKILKNGIIVDKRDMQDLVIEIVSGNHYVERSKSKKYVTDNNDSVLTAAWIDYLVVMVLVSLTNGRIGAWILISIIFFAWRYNYKEKECVYYD